MKDWEIEWKGCWKTVSEAMERWEKRCNAVKLSGILCRGVPVHLSF